ncbi:MAG: PLDc N-terminal domain-containing protein [Phycisphaeraceae bacterium]|nr:PLDc N-terminal domain-containing protein [Phycisphaeraceae bacterium]
MVGALLGSIVLLDLAAIVLMLSERMSPRARMLWLAAIVAAPVLGSTLYATVHRNQPAKRMSGRTVRRRIRTSRRQTRRRLRRFRRSRRLGGIIGPAASPSPVGAHPRRRPALPS